MARRTDLHERARFLIRRATSAGYPTLVGVWLRSLRATHTFLTEGDIQALLPLVRHADG